MQTYKVRAFGMSVTHSG